MTQHVVATVDEIPPGTHKLVTVRGREIGVFNVKGDYYALLNRCPHAGASLCRGRVGGLVVSDGPGEYEILREGEILRCPWHGWEYDIRTGQSWCDPVKVNTQAIQGHGRTRRPHRQRPLHRRDVSGPCRPELCRGGDVIPRPMARHCPRLERASSD